MKPHEPSLCQDRVVDGACRLALKFLPTIYDSLRSSAPADPRTLLRGSADKGPAHLHVPSLKGSGVSSVVLLVSTRMTSQGAEAVAFQAQENFHRAQRPLRDQARVQLLFLVMKLSSALPTRRSVFAPQKTLAILLWAVVTPNLLILWLDILDSDHYRRSLLWTVNHRPD